MHQILGRHGHPDKDISHNAILSFLSVSGLIWKYVTTYSSHIFPYVTAKFLQWKNICKR